MRFLQWISIVVFFSPFVGRLNDMKTTEKLSSKREFSKTKDLVLCFIIPSLVIVSIDRNALRIQWWIITTMKLIFWEKHRTNTKRTKYIFFWSQLRYRVPGTSWTCVWLCIWDAHSPILAKNQFQKRHFFIGQCCFPRESVSKLDSLDRHRIHFNIHLHPPSCTSF